MNLKGKIYLIPCTLGTTNPIEVLPLVVKKTIENIDIFIVENEKNARRFIKNICPKKSQPLLTFKIINKYTLDSEIPEMLNPCMAGQHIGVISDAGCPGIADPGASVVEQAHLKGIKVIPLVGPSSILLAMMASGLNGQNFSFNGYLPIDRKERKTEIKRLEKLSSDFQQSQLFIETPYRNNQMLESLIKNLQSQTMLCVATDITLPTQYIKTFTVDQWKREKIDLHKRPTLFILQK